MFSTYAPSRNVIRASRMALMSLPEFSSNESLTAFVKNSKPITYYWHQFNESNSRQGRVESIIAFFAGRPSKVDNPYYLFVTCLVDKYIDDPNTCGMLIDLQALIKEDMESKDMSVTISWGSKLRALICLRCEAPLPLNLHCEHCNTIHR